MVFTAPETNGQHASTIGWILIALTWFMIEALWLVSSYLTRQNSYAISGSRLTGSELDR